MVLEIPHQHNADFLAVCQNGRLNILTTRRQHCHGDEPWRLQELSWNLGAGKEISSCLSMSAKGEPTTDRLRWKRTNGSDSNEIICIISTDNYALVTKIHKGNEHNYVTATAGQWTYYTIGAVIYKSWLLHFMHLWEQNEAFPLLYPIKLGETNIWRNCSGNGPSVVIPFWEFSVVLLGDFEWGVWGEVRTIPGPFSLLQPRVMLPLSLLKIGCPIICIVIFLIGG